MFLEFDNYFVNLAQVDDVSVASEFPDMNIWDVFIYMVEPNPDPEYPKQAIPMRQGFIGRDHAEAFKRAVLRFACTTGFCTGEDMDRIFVETDPAGAR